MKKTTTYTSIVLMVIGTLSLAGCKTQLAGNRGMYGHSANHMLNSQLGNRSYKANVGIYLVYNTNERTSGLPNRTLNTGGLGNGSAVSVVGQGNNATPYEQIPGQDGVVSMAGSNLGGGTANCMLRRFDIPVSGRAYYTRQSNTNTSIGRAIAQFPCSTNSNVAVSARGAMATNTFENGQVLTYVPLDITGGTLGHKRLELGGSIGAIDAGDSGYIVASLAPDHRNFNTLVVMSDNNQDNNGISYPTVLYEVPFGNDVITDLAIDENHGKLFIALRSGNYGKIIAYNLDDSEAFAQDNLRNAITRSQALMPPNTFLRSSIPNQAVHSFDHVLGYSVFIASTAFKKITNFDGLTAALDVSGRIYAIADYYKNTTPADKVEEIEAQTQAKLNDFEYTGSQSGFLGNVVANTGSSYTYPGSDVTRGYNDVAVGHNIFYIIGGNSINYFTGDMSLIFNGNQPRHRNLQMGTLRKIFMDNKNNLIAIASTNGIKVCRPQGASLDCGPNTSADLTENNGAAVLDVSIMPKIFSVTPKAEDVTTGQGPVS